MSTTFERSDNEAPGAVTSDAEVMLSLDNVGKAFTLHLHRATSEHADYDSEAPPVVLDALTRLSMEVRRGECVALIGPSGAGKSSVLKMIYGTYRVTRGALWLRDGADWTNIAVATPRTMHRLRTYQIGYVSQFLRVVPRVGALDVVCEPALARGVPEASARDRAAQLLERLNIPPHMWHLPPATFSGGEQQRINIARGLCADHPVLLLDEPTASLDLANRSAVIELIAETKARGHAILGVFHDEATRSVADRRITITSDAEEASFQ